MDTQRVVERIGKVTDTFYGKLLTFTTNLAVVDSTYTNASLNTHHDTTYFYDPAGVDSAYKNASLYNTHYDTAYFYDQAGLQDTITEEQQGRRLRRANIGHSAKPLPGSNDRGGYRWRMI